MKDTVARVYLEGSKAKVKLKDSRKLKGRIAARLLAWTILTRYVERGRAAVVTGTRKRGRWEIAAARLTEIEGRGTCVVQS